MFAGVNDMLLDMLAAIARRDYDSAERGKRKVSPRLGRMASIEDGKSIKSGMRLLTGYWPAAVRGRRCNKRLAVAEARSAVQSNMHNQSQLNLTLKAQPARSTSKLRGWS